MSYVGLGPVGRAPAADRLISLHCSFHDWTMSVGEGHAPGVWVSDRGLDMVVTEAACRRLFGGAIESGRWHLSVPLRSITIAIRDAEGLGDVGHVLRLAKSMELLCCAAAHLRARSLLPADGSGVLSRDDAVRIAAARQLIDERFHEKLTLETIARSCGLNRAKLTRDFRATFSCTVADAIQETRLASARQMLLGTSLPVSVVGFRCGYQSNASFTRAFSRRFGRAPTQLRNERIAA